MAQVISFACELAGVARRYKLVHDALFKVSLWQALRFSENPYASVDVEILAVELGRLHDEAEALAATAAGLSGDELPKRAGEAMRDSVVEYGQGLCTAIERLREICEHSQHETTAAGASAAEDAARQTHQKAAYDDSLQELKRRGARLNELFESF